VHGQWICNVACIQKFCVLAPILHFWSFKDICILYLQEEHLQGTMRGYEDVEDALDELRAHNVPFLGKYTVLGAMEPWRMGGLGVVQFMRGNHDGANYAAKVCTC
jgi:hypothetical protein